MKIGWISLCKRDETPTLQKGDVDTQAFSTACSRPMLTKRSEDADLVFMPRMEECPPCITPFCSVRVYHFRHDPQHEVCIVTVPRHYVCATSRNFEGAEKKRSVPANFTRYLGNFEESHVALQL